MKVLKVVHATSPEELELEHALAVIQTFDRDSFLATHETQIMEYSKHYEAPQNEEEIVKTSGARATRIASRIARTGFDGIRTAAAMREYCIERAMRQTIELLLADLRQQLENVDVIPLETARERYPATHSLSVGTYTLHPCDSKRLAQLEHFHRNLASEKDDELIDLLGKMGADTVKIVERDEDQSQWSVGGSAEQEIVDAGAGAGLSLAKRISRNRELVVVYEGTDLEIDPYLLANSLWFTNDSQLSAIFESRRSANPIRQYTLKSTYTQTFDFDFKAALTALAVKVDLKAEYETLRKTERFFHVDFG